MCLEKQDDDFVWFNFQFFPFWLAPPNEIEPRRKSLKKLVIDFLSSKEILLYFQGNENFCSTVGLKSELDEFQKRHCDVITQEYWFKSLRQLNQYSSVMTSQ